ncbi:hypothetical protein E2C01_023749 [Portunus trituberculatus]|uniref:Uncharacterized protein n=1 Tax=Portunus trituberculatus TaxID=210409 RepID=A0A5B7E8T2_PORTR|nr:hypothetical protein [Portunus trituberculatus]
MQVTRYKKEEKSLANSADEKLHALTAAAHLVRGDTPCQRTFRSAIHILTVTIIVIITNIITVIATRINAHKNLNIFIGPYGWVTILLSLTVFHNLVTETLPQVSDAMPVLGRPMAAARSPATP